MAAADPVAAAVATAEQPSVTRMARREFTVLATGRSFAIEYPVGLELIELLALVAWATHDLPAFAEQDRVAAAGIVLPQGVPLPSIPRT